MRIAGWLSIAALAGGFAFFVRPRQEGSRSKLPRAVLDAALQDHQAEAAKMKRLWQPVAAAMASGEVIRTRAAVDGYVSAGGVLGHARLELGRFCLSKGDRVDAKAMLDHLVNPFNPLSHTGVLKRARPVRSADAEALCLWLEAAANAPQSEKRAVLDRWYANYNNYGLRPSKAFDDMKLNGEALREFEAGQYCLGYSITYK